jgi:hypothetical protein
MELRLPPPPFLAVTGGRTHKTRQSMLIGKTMLTDGLRG